ncbi:hypothetical protein [Labrys monachus]|uniref:Uncharacterized protein n=1 Tax=Labrys monachus TaxID=217067 RepID=A0ABU0FG19_9HYPH|nr:hypothetical protein [Labrys monachus]MDQ0393553.1 hypothetical protein [Labrys monachus]
MAEPVKKDEALAAAVREAFQRHMENARLAAQALKEKQAQAQSSRLANGSTASTSAARDPRMKVPEAANQRDGGAPPRPAGPAAASAETGGVNPSLGRLVALASPQKANEANGSARAEEAADPDNAARTIDFGEALFNEIAQELDWKTETSPRMPKAASLETTDEQDEDAADDADKAGEGSATAQPLGTQPKANARISVVPLPAPARRTSRFGVAPPAAAEAKRASKFAPTRPVNTNDALFAAKARSTGRVRIPAALLASLVIGAAIIAVLGYFWGYPEKLRSLGMLVAPPAPPSSGTNVVAAKPAPAASVQAPQQAAGADRQPLSHSVTTVAIKVDEVDQAVQSAHEFLAAGHVDEARAALAAYRTGSDARALFALAETYDPAIVHDAAQADAVQARGFYEAAAKAGSQDTADRIARLQIAPVN